MSKPGPKGPQFHLDWEAFEDLCGLHCTQEDIAHFFKCSVDTVSRHVKEHYEEDYAAVYKRFSSVGRISLRRQMFSVAKSGNVTMLIWLSKQHLGMRDKFADEISDEDRAYALKAKQLNAMSMEQLHVITKEILERKVVPIRGEK